MTNSRANTKQALRRFYRARRKALSNAAREQAAHNIAEHLLSLSEYQNSQNIAVYSAMPEEISLHLFIQKARAQGKSLFLPVIDTQTKINHMVFRAWQTSDDLNLNAHGILEPQAQPFKQPEPQLDLMLMPLVAFDHRGHRLGMGGGYYDRYFEKINLCNNDNTQKKSITTKKPERVYFTRIGIAHSCQMHADIPCESWDIKLHAAVTEKEFLDFR